MIKIIEEALENIIRRIDRQDELIAKLQGHTTPQTQPNERINKSVELASPGQIKYLRALGGKVWNGMTKKQASQKIDDRLKMQEKTQEETGYKTRAGAVNSMKKNFKSFKKGRVKVVYKK